MLILRWLLLPISLLYACITWLRNRLYDHGLLKSRSFQLPVVVIGNLAVGGTGKSPMTEHILRIVKDTFQVAVLSRGYGRRTKGFRYVETNSLATEVGDEPLQIKRKFPNTTVAVSENRCYGIDKLQAQHDAILLDDAYQHRQLKPSFSILLFDYASMLQPMLSLPTGNFRDSLHESKRAQIIVITKCPSNIPEQVKEDIKTRLAKYSAATVFFSRIAYQTIINGQGATLTTEELANKSVLLLTGIANPKPLDAFIRPLAEHVYPLVYSDHHDFSAVDIKHIQEKLQSIQATNKIILTTEKDYQRLPADFCASQPIFYIPIQQEIVHQEGDTFEKLIKEAFSRA